MLISYHNTLSNFGPVNRAEIKVKHSLLTETIERCNISKNEDSIFYKNEKGKEISLNINTLVSMNMWGLQASIFSYFKADLDEFLNTYKLDNKSEWQLPTLINHILSLNKLKIHILETNEKWIGVTYLADKKFAKQYLNDIHLKNSYNTGLWNSL